VVRQLGQRGIPQVKVTRDGAEVSGIAEVVEDLERKRRIISANRS